MNAISSVLVAVVLAAMVTYGSCTNINCYACSGTFSAISGAYIGCDYPFNTTSQPTVSCPGVCTKMVIFDADNNDVFTGNGALDSIVRGCTLTYPVTGCYTPEKDQMHAHRTVCISTCSTDLCNSADGLRAATAVVLSAIVGLVAYIRN